MMKRQPDGTWRNTRQAVVVSEPLLRARWVEAETIRLKRMGFSFDAIAEQITRVGRSQAQAMVTIPQGVTFPSHYKITRQACHKAFKKAIAREPSLELEELRKLHTARCEDMLLYLQASIRKGNVPAIEASIKLLGHEAKINGCASPQKHEPTGKDSRPTMLQFLEALDRFRDDDC